VKVRDLQEVAKQKISNTDKVDKKNLQFTDKMNTENLRSLTKTLKTYEGESTTCRTNKTTLVAVNQRTRQMYKTESTVTNKANAKRKPLDED